MFFSVSLLICYNWFFYFCYNYFSAKLAAVATITSTFFNLKFIHRNEGLILIKQLFSYLGATFLPAKQSSNLSLVLGKGSICCFKSSFLLHFKTGPSQLWFYLQVLIYQIRNWLMHCDVSVMYKIAFWEEFCSWQLMCMGEKSPMQGKNPTLAYINSVLEHDSFVITSQPCL